MQPVELARVLAQPAEASAHFEGRAVENPDHVVGAVGDEQPALPGIFGQGDARRRAAAEGRGTHEGLGDERALPVEDLHAVVGAVGHVDPPVAGDCDVVHGAAVMADGFGVGVVGGQGAVVGALAVGPPVPAVLAGVGVEHDDAAVAVAVGHVDLVGLRVHPDARGPP